MVAVKGQMTARTNIPPFIQSHFLTVPAAAAILRGVGGIYRNVLPTSIFCFVRKTFCEPRPRRVQDALTHTAVMYHPVDRQIFHADDAEAINYFPRFLMREIVPFELNPFMHTRDNLPPLSSGRRAWFCLSQFALRLRQSLFFAPKEARVSNPLIRRKVSKGFQSYINTDI